jgi:hypothetical protein
MLLRKTQRHRVSLDPNKPQKLYQKQYIRSETLHLVGRQHMVALAQETRGDQSGCDLGFGRIRSFQKQCHRIR